MRTCIACTRDLPLAQFNRHKYSRGGYHARCKDCIRWYRMEHTFGIGRDEYEQMLADQGGGCAICGSTHSGQEDKPQLQVDHCHETGRIRGLLCGPCNRKMAVIDDENFVALGTAYKTSATTVVKEAQVSPGTKGIFHP